MKIRGIKKGDKDLRHFTFDDGDVVERAGTYMYKVLYDKNPLEGEYAEEEVGYIECDKVIPLGGRKPKPIVKKEEKPKVEIPATVKSAGTVEKPKRGRPPKVTKITENQETIPVKAQEGTSKFEYYVAELKITDATELQDQLNQLGDEGWELCCYDVDKSLFSNTHIRMIFKRKRG